MKTSIINVAKTGLKQFFDIDPNITEHFLTQSAFQAGLVKEELLYAVHLKKQIFVQAFNNWATAFRPEMPVPEYSA